ncbi:MAG: DUF6057 family protein [Planctomycetota bacterium]|jgi:hypothetical protein
MLNSLRKSINQNLGEIIQSLIFFILFYLYLCFKVDPRLIYHGGGVITNFPVFYRTWNFFSQFTSYPGGLVEYLSDLLSQFSYYPWAGALVITMVAWLISVCMDIFIKTINAHPSRWLRFIPPILILITYNRYTYHFTTTMALLAALFFTCLYLKLTRTSKPGSLIVYLVLSVILYYIAGGAYLLFAILCAIYELLFTRRWQLVPIYILSALVIPYIGGVFIFGISAVEAFTELLPVSPKILTYEARKRVIEIVYILYLLLPLTALVFGLWRISTEKKIKEKPPSRIFSWYTSTPMPKWFIELCLLLVFTGSVVLLSHDNKLKTTLEVEYYALHEMWPEVLDAFHRHPDNLYIVHTVNRALYHTGRLGYDMFSYPQHPDTLFITSKIHVKAFWRRSHIYIDLGVMNLGEGALAESMVELGERPMILKRLALINMVKGNIGTAKTYLGALGKTLFHTELANNYLNLLETDPNLSTDKEIQRLRQLMMEAEYGFTTYVPEKILLELLQKNRQNRMAFEYLMAWYMLTKQLDKFVQNLDRLDDFDYPDIPRHYQEAILIYEVFTNKKIDLKGRQISNRTLRRARTFGNIVNRFSNANRMPAARATAGDFGDTYFFYFNFGSVLIKR